MSYKNTPDAWKMDGLELSVDQKLNDVYDIASTAAAASLPAVSSADNGKALLVKSGKWQKSAIPPQLPTVSGTDNGDVLTVVEGAWSKAAPSGGDAFEVKFTAEYDQQSSEYVVTSDKTYAEISAAYTANKKIYAWLSSANNPTLLTTGYVHAGSTTFIFYFNDKNDPGYYARWQITVGTESITAFVSYECEPVYISGDYADGNTLDESSLAVFNNALNSNGAPVYINISLTNIGIYPFIFIPSDETGYCFAGPASAIGATAVIDSETGEITVTAPNS